MAAGQREEEDHSQQDREPLGRAGAWTAPIKLPWSGTRKVSEGFQVTSLAPLPPPMSKWLRMTKWELLLVVLAMLAMAAIVVPVSRCELQDAYEGIVAEELQRWSEAVHAYLVDHGMNEMPAVLVGPGTLPNGIDAATDPSALERLLMQPRLSDRSKRFYLKDVGPDPWGRAYVVLTAAAVPRHACWVLSAGRDGRLETSALDVAPVGDDLGLPLR